MLLKTNTYTKRPNFIFYKKHIKQTLYYAIEPLHLMILKDIGMFKTVMAYFCVHFILTDYQRLMFSFVMRMLYYKKNNCPITQNLSLFLKELIAWPGQIILNPG